MVSSKHLCCILQVMGVPKSGLRIDDFMTIKRNVNNVPLNRQCTFAKVTRFLRHWRNFQCFLGIHICPHIWPHICPLNVIFSRQNHEDNWEITYQCGISIYYYMDFFIFTLISALVIHILPLPPISALVLRTRADIGGSGRIWMTAGRYSGAYEKFHVIIYTYFSENAYYCNAN